MILKQSLKTFLIGLSLPLFLFTNLGSLPTAMADNSDELNRARAYFEQGYYQRSIDTVNQLLESYQLTKIDEIKLAHTLLAAAHYHSNNEKLAAEHFTSLLNFDERAQLDEYYYSPKVRDFFAAIKKQWLAKSAEARDRVATPMPISSQPRPQKSDTTLNTNLPNDNFGLRLLPFGTGQFLNGERQRGWLFAISQGIFLTSAAASFAVFQSSANNVNNADDRDTLSTIFTASLVGFGSLAVVGIFDAVFDYERKDLALKTAAKN